MSCLITTFRILPIARVRVACVNPGYLRNLTDTSHINRDGELVFESLVDVPLSDSQQKASISVINLNDSKNKNTLSNDLVWKMMRILEYSGQKSTEGKSTVRAMILRSNVPGIFCAGANLKERQRMSSHQVESWLNVQRRLMTCLAKFPYPTIAAIDGHALGGGLEMALACDIRVVNEKAKIGLVETRLAIIPGAGGTQRLARLIGVGKAKEHILVAEPVDGPEAVRLGIASHLTKDEEGSFKKALELAEKICQRGPIALRLAKKAVDEGSEVSLEKGLDLELDLYRQLLDSQDRAEGMKAFFEKRQPVYHGD